MIGVADKQKISGLGEWGLISRFLPKLKKNLSPHVWVKPGDDAAVVKAKPGHWVITTDMMVEGVHFEVSWTNGQDLGHKLLAINLSDLAAMGAVDPQFGVVSLGITPQFPVNYVDNFYKGLQKTAKECSFDIIGGDTVRSDRIVASMAVMGLVKSKKKIILRRGARVGDILLLTGTAGDAAAGLSLIAKNRPRLSKHTEIYLKTRLRRPKPKLDLCKKMIKRGGVTALIDTSDSLWRSLFLLCEASSVGALVKTEDIPISPAFRCWAGKTRSDPFDLILGGGEDYELLLTADPQKAKYMQNKGWAKAIGQIVPQCQGLKISKREFPEAAS